MTSKQRMEEGLALPILVPGARRVWVMSATPRRFNPRECDAVPIVQQAWWASTPVWMVPKNLHPTVVRTLACFESLYRLGYPCDVRVYRNRIEKAYCIIVSLLTHILSHHLRMENFLSLKANDAQIPGARLLWRRWRIIFVRPQHESSLMSQFWCLESWSSFSTFGNFLHPRLKVSKDKHF